MTKQYNIGKRNVVERYKPSHGTNQINDVSIAAAVEWAWQSGGRNPILLC
jgi:hypothetical protein